MPTAREHAKLALAAAAASKLTSNKSWEHLVMVCVETPTIAAHNEVVAEAEAEWKKKHGKLPPVWGPHKALLTKANQLGIPSAEIRLSGASWPLRREDVLKNVKAAEPVKTPPHPDWLSLQADLHSIFEQAVLIGHGPVLKTFLKGVIDAL